MRTCLIPSVFSLELYQFFFLFFKTLIRWINLGLGFSLKVIFRIWILRSDSNQLFFKGIWWDLFWLNVLFSNLYRWYQLVMWFDYAIKVIVILRESFCFLYIWSFGIKAMSILWWYRSQRRWSVDGEKVRNKY